MPRLNLQNLDARLACLAIVYHLGRPGSETNALTLERHELGLGPVRDALEPHLQQAVVEIDLSDYQLSRLGQALHGIANELKQLDLAQGRSAVPGFAGAMGRLFPDAQHEAGATLDLVQHAIMLRRRLDAVVRVADAAVQAAREEQAQLRERERRPWWKLWRR